MTQTLRNAAGYDAVLRHETVELQWSSAQPEFGAALARIKMQVQRAAQPAATEAPPTAPSDGAASPVARSAR